MKTAFIFPGQGSQYVGMGKDIYDNFNEVKKIFDESDESLGFPLSDLCFFGPEEELRKTKNTQPAILTHSISAFILLANKGIKPDCVAGHSVGEYSALVAAGSIQFSDAVKLVRIRGELMSEADSGSMLAILGLTKDEVLEICSKVSEFGIIEPANFNCPGQVVVSGESLAIDKAIDMIKTKGKGKVIQLSVSGPFHSSLMNDAGNKLKEYLKNINIKEAKIKIIANFNADYVKTPEEIKNALAKQVSNPVRWEETILRMLNDGVEKFIEVGPGKVLSSLVKRIKKDCFITNVEDILSFHFAEKLL